ncbi:MAG: hypothetical protein ACLP01_31785 [Solirubrobacteraceae bacterium]
MWGLGAIGATALPVSPALGDLPGWGDLPGLGDLIDMDACNTSPLSQPFAPWGDSAFYELAPGGDFTSPAWTLSDGAQIVSGGAPYAATGASGSSSLSLPAGGSAQSPSTCVDAAYPTIRFFIAGSGTVAVEILSGDVVIPAGITIATGDWQPTPVMITDSAVAGALSGGTAQISLQLVGIGGNAQVDDVFIDPWNRGP